MEKEVGLLEFVKDSMEKFGEDVNTNRQLNSVYDGLKPVYRRAFVTTLEQGDKFMKVASISGKTIATTHPHGDASVNPVISNMVRYGIFEGVGNHGVKRLRGDAILPAAPRYIEAKVDTKYRELIGPLMSYVPWVESEMEGFQEPQFLPVPFPMCLTFGSLGIGIGVNCRIPAFTPKSMYDALKHDDPTYLQAPFGLDIIDSEEGLWSLWNTGLGKLTYSFKVEWKGKGCYIIGEPELFSPNLSEFEELVESGKIYMNDETNGEGSKLYIQRNYNIRSVTDDMIWEMAQRAARTRRDYRLTVTDGTNAFLIPLKEWLKRSYENYLSIVERYKQDNIDKLNFDYKVYDWLSTVANEMIKNPNITNEQIADKFELDIEVVKSIMSKSISTLRKADTKEKLKSIKKKLKEFESIVPEEWTENIINEF